MERSYAGRNDRTYSFAKVRQEMETVWIVLLVLGCLWILGQWCWYVLNDENKNEYEGFQTWSLGALDKKAREGQMCEVRESFPDDVFPDAMVEIVGESCEDGLPHTSDANTIRITKTLWGAPDRRQSVLRHERVHLMQRRQPNKWRDFYQSAWQYTLSAKEPPHMPAEVLDAVRGNPDTEGERWATWKGRYTWVPLYSNTEAPTLGAATVRVWDSVTKGWAAEAPAAWRHAFCLESGECPYQSEHPHEIAAEMWTDIDKWSATPAGFQLRQFMETVAIKAPEK